MPKPTRQQFVLEQILNPHTPDADGEPANGEAYAAAPSCSIKQVPERLRHKAAETAVRVFPVNAPAVGFALPPADLPPGVDSPAELTVLVTKYWGPQPRTLTVSFMSPVGPARQKLILEHMNAWSARCGIRFALVAGGGTVRIAFAATGFWSYLGTDVLLIPQHLPTMNLQGFDRNPGPPLSEYRRVIRHETGHTLGFPHEHMRKELVNRISPAKAYPYFLQTQGWNKAMVDAQVLTPLSDASIMGTPADQTSIMCYQLPGLITKNGQPIVGGTDINETDFRFAASIYPKPGAAPAAFSATEGYEAEAEAGDAGDDDWAESEDVEVNLAAGL